MEESIKTSQERFILTVFVELFTVHLLGKESRLYHLFVQRYSQNGLCCKHFGVSGIPYFDYNSVISP
jgi:hypothetical protein